MKKVISLSAISMITVLSFNVVAEEDKGENGQIIAKVSTMGAGVEYVHPINSILSIGFGINKFSFSESFTESDINYQTDVDFKSLSVIANYHPWENGFRLRGGAYYNKNKIALHASEDTSTSIDTIGNSNFTGAQVALDGELSFQKFAPYIGIGYGSEPFGDNNLSLDIDVGIMRSPVTAKLSGTCSVGGVVNAGVCATNNFDAELANEQADLTSATDGFDFYPIISLGISYRF